eukprot:1155250-Pelagomonas_calceolata.AAC.4
MPDTQALRLVSKRFEKLPSDQQHTLENIVQSQQPILPPTASSPNLVRKVQNWKEWAYTDGVYHPDNDSPNYVQPNGARPTNTVVRAKLSATAAAILQGRSYIAIDSLSSLHHIRKETLYAELCSQHVQGHVRKIIVQLVRNSPTLIYLYKVKPHAGIAGNNCADAIAKHQAIQGDDTPADTTFPCVNLGGNPFHDTIWLAFEEAARSHASTSEGPKSP